MNDSLELTRFNRGGFSLKIGINEEAFSDDKKLDIVNEIWEWMNNHQTSSMLCAMPKEDAK